MTSFSFTFKERGEWHRCGDGGGEYDRFIVDSISVDTLRFVKIDDGGGVSIEKPLENDDGCVLSKCEAPNEANVIPGDELCASVVNIDPFGVVGVVEADENWSKELLVIGLNILHGTGR